LYQKLKKARAAVEEYNKMRAGKSHEEKPTVAEGRADKTQTKNQQESSCADDVNKQEDADAAASPISSMSSSETVQHVPMQTPMEQYPGAQRDSQCTEDKASPPGEEHMTGESPHHEQEQKTTKKELLPSEITYAALRKAFDRGPLQEVDDLARKFAAQASAEEAERQAQAVAAEKHRVTCEDSAHQEDEEEFAEEEESEIQPERITINIGGRPAKTAGLIDEDLIRRGDVIKAVQYFGAEDGIINRFSRRFELRWHLRSLYQPLYESLILPTGVEDFWTIRELFDGISALLRKHVMLPSKDCSLLAYWAIATWFTDYLPFLPSVVISGPASTADLLLRTLVAVCRRPVLLGELSPAILRKLPINEITPTLLIREPQSSRYMSALLSASNQPGYLFFSGKTFQQLYCPKCIYVGASFKDSPTSNSVNINLGGSALTPRHASPVKEEITSFQNRLFSYRLLNHDKVATANFRVPGFRPEVSIVAEVLAAAIVDDVELQRGIIEVLKDRDEQSRVDRATGVNGLVLRAVLFHCHQQDQRKLVREIAATANRLYAEDGESLKLSSEAIGHVLKSLGLYSHRFGNAGRGLIFDKATQSHAHRLSHSYDVLSAEPSCEHCHELQQPQSEGVVQDV
jgi:hypothetical protein